MINVGVYGALGKMGRSNIIAANNHPDIKITAAIENSNNQYIGQEIGPFCGIHDLPLKISDNLHDALKYLDVMLDFTTPDATMKLIEANAKYKKALVIGSTGLSTEQENIITNASKEYPIAYSPNFSIGTNLLFKLAEIAAEILNKENGYDLEIYEAHHRFKKDAPSGTALKLARITADKSGRSFYDGVKYGRQGHTGERSPDEIGIHVVRAGDIVGEHTAMFCTQGERLELTHKAHSRETFSKGAIMAALFVSEKKNGLYEMWDVLNKA